MGGGRGRNPIFVPSLAAFQDLELGLGAGNQIQAFPCDL